MSDVIVIHLFGNAGCLHATQNYCPRQWPRRHVAAPDGNWARPFIRLVTEPCQKNE